MNEVWNDVWFEPQITRDDLHAVIQALSLQGKEGTPFLAITGGDSGATQLVVASHALFGLFGASSAEMLATRLMRGSDPGARRLSILARTLTAGGAPRLERLRFYLGPGSEIITFICRRITAGDRTIFVAAALGVRADLIATNVTPIPTTAEAPTLIPAGSSLLAPGSLPSGSDVLDEPPVVSEAMVVPPPAGAQEAAPRQDVAALQAALRARWPSTRSLRFLWQTDSDAICTLITPPLADVVGHGTADLVGRNLLDLAPQLDPTGRFAGKLVSRETWSGLDLQWPMADEAASIAVTAGAIPAFDPDKVFQGYRGFGVIHLDRLSDALPMTFAAMASTTTPNVVSFPGAALTVDERQAFEDIGATLRVDAPEPAADEPETVSLAAVEPATATPSTADVVPSAEEADAAVIDPRLDPPSEIAGQTPEAQAAPETRVAPEAVTSPEPVRPMDKVAGLDHATRDQEIGRNGLSILDKLNLGILVSRDNVPIFANRHLLDMLGFADEDALHAAGGMTHLFGGLPGNVTGSETVGVRGRDGSIISANARMQAIDWDGLPATMLTLRPNTETGKQVFPPNNTADAAAKTEGVPRADAGQDPKRQRDDEVRELRAILETATDGVAVLDGAFTVLSLNRSGEALFGCDRGEVVGKPFLALFAPHNQSLASDYCEGLKSNATLSLLNDGREILVRAHRGGTIPVFMTLGRLGPSGEQTSAETQEGARYCALFRDLTHWKKVEQELDHARKEAERASALKSDFLAKVSHEIRTPLNAIIGFAEVIMDERFGPVGNARYKDYLKDIHYSGTHVMSLVNDLLDLSKIEAGKMELNAVAIDTNKIVTECVGIMQPQASQERVIMRLSLAATLPAIKADERSLRQIVLNLLSNAVKFNEPGGQVIIATALTETGQVVIRIRDTGPGMSDTDIEKALEPFRQLSTSRPMTTGTGLGLPLTKALVEANHASFTIRSKLDQGTLVEVAFPTATALAI